MKSDEIRQRFLTFFEARNHVVLPSASLIPENDPSVLFNTAGMQPLVPYLLGEKHPQGVRLADIQKCVRTVDIDDIGDNTHATFFEMMGNWSLGDYFKQEAITWSYELLTSKEKGFGLDPKRLYVTVFEGDANAPRDDESAEIWKKAGVPAHRIYFLPAQSNWWEAGPNGPCGPDSEMFYDVTERGLGDLTHEEFLAADERRDVVEVWNDVFMEYVKKDGAVIGKLPKKNVDTGAGLERLAMVLQHKNNIYETDLFSPLMDHLHSASPTGNLKMKRIIADHVRTAVFMLSDGITPSNTDRGYILRRLIRRAVRLVGSLELPNSIYKDLIHAVSIKYQHQYPVIKNALPTIELEFLREVEKFTNTLSLGLRKLEKLIQTEFDVEDPNLGTKKQYVSGTDVFDLYQTYGFPIELTEEVARENGLTIDRIGFNALFEAHQALSRTSAGEKFKGGLADTSEMSVKYHTATHLLHQALHDVLGDAVSQKGSNITPERLRFDFVHDSKMTDEEKKRVEHIINQKIAENLPVHKIVLPKAEALKTGARHSFTEKYGDDVNIYYIGPTLETAYSKEFCGGPHVAHTGELGTFTIVKEEAVAAGIRRIKAVLA